MGEEGTHDDSPEEDHDHLEGSHQGEDVKGYIAFDEDYRFTRLSWLNITGPGHSQPPQSYECVSRGSCYVNNLIILSERSEARGNVRSFITYMGSIPFPISL